MKYYLDDYSTDLDAVRERLQSTDLIPSQEPLLDGLAEKLTSITRAGVTSLADLRGALKTEKSLASLSNSSGVDVGYLQLLRRVINGYFPKPRPLKDIDWLGVDVVNSLKKIGITNTRQLFDAASAGVTGLASRAGIDRQEAKELFAISDLCRIQWVSPSFARVLVAAGVTNAAEVAKADSEALFDAIETANLDAKFYKGKVGLRDINRLVTAATYVP